MEGIVVNGRILGSHITGMQRYLLELLRRWRNPFSLLRTERLCHGITGHFWEQFILPTKLRHSLLFSPSNTGPLAVGRQVVTIHDTVLLDHPE